MTKGLTGADIRRIRKKAKIEAGEMAREMGYSAHHLLTIEKGYKSGKKYRVPDGFCQNFKQALVKILDKRKAALLAEFALLES